jgi:hypothetical protein
MRSEIAEPRLGDVRHVEAEDAEPDPHDREGESLRGRHAAPVHLVDERHEDQRPRHRC